MKLADWQTEDPNGHRRGQLVYELGYRAIVRMQDKGIPVIRNEFTGHKWHRLMSCMWRADIDFYGAERTPHIAIIPTTSYLTSRPANRINFRPR